MSVPMRALFLCSFALVACEPAVKGPTYFKDVLPITQASCNGCHTAGGIAPFALDTPEAAQSRATLMADAVKNKRMPPWLASDACGGPFVGDRSLTQGQIDTIAQWAETGAAKGNEADAPAPVDPPAALTTVSFSQQMPAPYTPSQRDDYRCFIMDPATTKQEVVTGYDILPGSKKVVHHVILYVVPRSRALAKEAEDATPGWECFGGANVTTNGTVGAWAPGSEAVVFPRDTGIRINTDEVIAMQVHYNLDNGTDSDQTTIRLQYGTGRERSAILFPLVADRFNIPPMARAYQHSESIQNTLGFSAYLWGFLPHMHTKGKTITLRAGNECLVDIPRWDFHWQSQYYRRTPVILPDGASFTISCSWDNPTMQNVTWGEGTSDEMCFAFVYATLG